MSEVLIGGDQTAGNTLLGPGGTYTALAIWQNFTSNNSGLLTSLAADWGAHPPGNVILAIYDSNNNLLGNTAPTPGVVNNQIISLTSNVEIYNNTEYNLVLFVDQKFITMNVLGGSAGVTYNLSWSFPIIPETLISGGGSGSVGNLALSGIGMVDNIPQIFNISTNNTVESNAVNVTMTGQYFTGITNVNIAQPNANVSQNFTFIDDTTVLLDIIMEPATGAHLAFSDNTYPTWLTLNCNTANVNGLYATANINLIPANGMLFKTLSNINPNANVFTANIAFDPGDQLQAAGDANGLSAPCYTTLLFEDGTFFGTSSFYLRVYDSANTVWTNYALQTLILPSNNITQNVFIANAQIQINNNGTLQTFNVANQNVNTLLDYPNANIIITVDNQIFNITLDSPKLIFNSNGTTTVSITNPVANSSAITFSNGSVTLS